MSEMTDAQICLQAANIVNAYKIELETAMAATSNQKQLGFLQYQLDSIPGAMFLLGCVSGRDSLKRKLSLEELDTFDREQAK